MMKAENLHSSLERIYAQMIVWSVIGFGGIESPV